LFILDKVLLFEFANSKISDVEFWISLIAEFASTFKI